MAVKTVQIPRELHTKLKREAQQSGMKLSALVEKWLRACYANAINGKKVL